MNIYKSITQVFESNMGNRITPELAAGMIRSLVDILAARVKHSDAAYQEPEHQNEREGDNVMV